MLLLLLLLDFDELYRSREQPVKKKKRKAGGMGRGVWLGGTFRKGEVGERDVRGGETTAGAGEKDLAERGLYFLIRYRCVVAVPVSRLELHEEAVRREEQPVQKRGGGLSMRWWWGL